MLTSLAVVKQALNLGASDTSQDAWLSVLKDSAEAAVKAYCRRNFEVATYTEYYGGSGQRQLVLRQRPVLSVASVAVDFFGNFGLTPAPYVPFDTNTLLVPGSDYSLDYDGEYPPGSGTKCSFNGVLLRQNTVWSERGRSYYPLQLTPENTSSDGTIKVVYTAGYDPVPFDVQIATAWIVAYLRRTIQIGGDLDEERIGDYSYHLHFPKYGLIPAEIGSARQLLSRYREVSI